LKGFVLDDIPNDLFIASKMGIFEYVSWIGDALIIIFDLIR